MKYFLIALCLLPTLGFARSLVQNPQEAKACLYSVTNAHLRPVKDWGHTLELSEKEGIIRGSFGINSSGDHGKVTLIIRDLCDETLCTSNERSSLVTAELWLHRDFEHRTSNLPVLVIEQGKILCRVEY